jgi:cold shock CspA family protein
LTGAGGGEWTERTGTIVSFDDHAGHGRVRGDDGEELFFHCTAIAGGSRTIDVGAPVRFRVVPGHHGRWEADDLVARQMPVLK